MPWPEPTPIDLISHSQAERLRSCLLQEAYRRDPRYRHLGAPSAAALLGRVCHQLSEDVARGSVTSEAELEQRWDDLIAAAQTTLQNAAFTDDAPAPRDWPGYQLSRARTLITLRRAVRERPTRAKAASDVATSDRDRSVFLELDILDEESRLAGRIDRVERDPDGTRIIDLKTGWSQAPTVTEQQRRQLLLYAHLWHVRTGEWPMTAMIRLADGRSSEIHIDVDEAQSIVTDAIEQRRRFNEQISRGWTRAATPSEEACAFCDFKACCPTFMSEADQSWRIPGEWVRGTISATSSHDGSVSLAPDDAAHAELDEIIVIGIPPHLDVAMDERVGFTGLSRTVTPTTLRTTWRSTLCRWR